MSSRPVVYLLDAHYQIFRAYHSLPDLRAPEDLAPEFALCAEVTRALGIPLFEIEGLFGRLGINAMLERVPRWRD